MENIAQRSTMVERKYILKLQLDGENEHRLEVDDVTNEKENLVRHEEKTYDFSSVRGKFNF